jgi:uncharacterized lipoprotein YddW (UPF0748 family)/N-acetylmuramoyl-L-alanine amidase
LFRSFGRVKWAILCFICLFTVIVAVLLAFSAMSRSSNTLAKSSLITSSKILSSSKSINSSSTVAPLSSADAITQLTVTGLSEMRAVWINTASNLNFPSKPGLSVDRQKTEIDTIINNVALMNMNTIILQVKTGASVLYKSQYFPWSEVLTGIQGQDPGYDPLAYFIQQAHQKGIQIQAWVNPYQIQTKADTTKLAVNNPAIMHPDWTVTGNDGGLYFDPGIPDVKKLIENGVKEIVQNYNIDGVLLDNFYPSKDFNDSDTFKKYGSVMSLEDWRRNNVDNLIGALHSDIKAINPSVPLGVSPFAVWANKAQYPPGSTTQSSTQTYYDQFADTRLWVQHNWIDYICPQIYWSLGFPATSFENATDWWVNTVKGTNVSFYVSQAAYKVGTNEAGWLSPDQIVKQLQYAKKYPEYKGSAFLGYKQLMANSGGVTDSIKKYFSNQLDPTFGTTLIVAAPQNNIITTESQVNITGTSDSNFPLSLNNKFINRSSKGMFSVVMKLTPGKNTFTLTHKGKTQVINVTYSVDVLKSIDPLKDILETGSTPISIIAVAHKDSTVYAQINGKKIEMTPTTFSGNDNSDTPAKVTDYITYTGIFTLPASKTSVQDLGNVKVTAFWNGFSKSMTGAKIKVKNYIPIIVGIKQIAILKIGAAEQYMPYIETYLYNDDMYRPSAVPQLAGSWDYVETNPDGSPKKYIYGNLQYYKLSNGEMIYTYNADIVAKAPPNNNKISSVNQTIYDNGRYTRFVFGCSQKITYNTSTNVKYPNTNKTGVRDYSISSFNATSFQITLYNTNQAVNVGALNNPLFTSVDCNKINNTTIQYVFHLKNVGIFYGSYISYDSSGNLVIDFKNPWNGDLSNLKISIDAGHGGYDPGALSPTGNSPNEKDINLKNAIMVRDKLIAMGVKSENVYMTRTGNSYTELAQRRVNMVNFRPDFTLCIHSNAFDGSAVGVESYYYQPYSQPLAKAVQNRLVQAYKDGGTADGGIYNYSGIGTNRGARFCTAVAYYSCRQIEVPSILVECGFVDNPNEYEFLTSNTGANLLTTALANGVIDFMYAQKQYNPNYVPSSSEVSSSSVSKSSSSKAYSTGTSSISNSSTSSSHTSTSSLPSSGNVQPSSSLSSEESSSSNKSQA